MSRKYHRCIGIVGNLREFLDENGALFLQAVDHVFVVDDLMADIDRGAIDGQGPFDGINGAHHPGAEAARRTKHEFQVWFGWHGSDLSTESPLTGGPGTVKWTVNSGYDFALDSGLDLGLLSGPVKALLSPIQALSGVHNTKRLGLLDKRSRFINCWGRAPEPLRLRTQSAYIRPNSRHR